MIYEKWKTEDGSIAEIDDIKSNGKTKYGTIHRVDSNVGTRCIWDGITGQSWGRDGWNLKEEIKDATTKKTD